MAKSNSQAHWWDSITRTHKMIIIVLVSIALYVNTIGHDFALDDAIVITENEFTKKGLGGIADLFKYDTFRGFFKVEGKSNLVAGGRYRPLSLAFFAAEISLFGVDPTFLHLMNVLWFSALCLLLFVTLERTFQAFGYKVAMLPFIMVLLFAVHPIHTEVVANIKGRDEILSMFFGTAALYFLLDPKRSIRSNVLAGISFLLAMLAKEMAATFIPIALWMYFMLENKSVKRSIVKSLPILIAFVPYLIIRFSVLGIGTGGETTMQMMNNPFVKVSGSSYDYFSANERIGSILFCLGFYIKLLFIPHPLTNDYYPRQIGIPTMGNWEVLLSILVYGVLIWLVFKYFKTNKILSFGIAYFLFSLILVSNIFFPIGTHMGERFCLWLLWGLV